MTLLPICESAIKIREFIRVHARYEFGLVSHAFCAAIKKIMREFDVLLAQLESLSLQTSCGVNATTNTTTASTSTSDGLSLQKLVYLLQPSKLTLSTIESLCGVLRDHVGGEFLDKLHTLMLAQGDEKSRALHLHLLRRASEPFVQMLTQWLFR